MSEGRKLEILKNILGTYHRSSNELLFTCPKCKHHKRKLSINFEKNVFKCWICDYHSNNIGRLVRRYGKFLDNQAWEELEGRIDLSESFYEKLFGDTEEKQEIQTVELPKEFVSLANKKLPVTAGEPLKYLKNRGITKQDIIKWKIGYCRTGDYEKRIIIPSFNEDGNVNFFVARTYADDWKKYMIPEGLSKDIVFNELYVDWKNDIVLTEGAFDAVKAENSVPLLGSTLREDSKLFQEIIKHDTAVYVALDADAEKKATKLIRSLLRYGVEVYKIDIDGFNDVGEMSKQDFQKRKKEAELMNSSSLLQREVQGIL